jgi:hypothetical protein
LRHRKRWIVCCITLRMSYTMLLNFPVYDAIEPHPVVSPEVIAIAAGESRCLLCLRNQMFR